MKSYFTELLLVEKVSYARNGQEVLNLVKESYNNGLKKLAPHQKVYKPIDLLILDVKMPQKNGLQVVTELKKFYAAQ